VTPTDLAPIGKIVALGDVAESLTSTGLQNSSAKLIPAESVLFSSRASIGKIAVTDRVCATNQGFINLTPKKDIVCPWFLAYLLGRYTSDLIQLAGKTTFLEIPRGKFKDFEVAIPSLPEQHRIVVRIKECMERVDEIEANATTVARELHALFPALLKERFAAIRDAHGARLLEEVADIRGGSSLPKGTGIDEGSASVLLVKVGDMNADGNERTIETAREFLPMTNAGRGAIEAGAVIFPKRGGAIATNKKRLLGRPALLDPNLMAVVANREVLRPDYLYYWCLALDLSKLSNGGVIPQLNRKDLAPLELPVPDIATQGQIVEALQQAEQHCSQLKIEFEGAQADRARLREAILRKAFAGEL
jgi:type I restriction enzyme S subunit